MKVTLHKSTGQAVATAVASFNLEPIFSFPEDKILHIIFVSLHIFNCCMYVYSSRYTYMYVRVYLLIISKQETRT